MNEQNNALIAIRENIERAAQKVAREWAGVIEPDDVVQEIALRLLEKNYATTVAELSEDEQYATLVKIGKQIASQYRSDYDHFSGNFIYSTNEVRALLGSGALEDQDTEYSPEYHDLREAYTRLPSRHANVLDRRFLFGEEVEYRAQVSRAIDALTAEMNRNGRQEETHEGPGARKALSNAAAAALSHRQLSRE